MLVICQVADPVAPWDAHRDDFTHQVTTLSFLTVKVSMYNKALLLLQENLDSLGCKRLANFSLPQPVPEATIRRRANNEYGIEELRDYVQENKTRLTPEQRDEVLKSGDERLGGIFFFGCPGWHRKNFSYELHSQLEVLMKLFLLLLLRE